MALSQLFWDVLMPWNLKSTYFSLKMIHFLSLNIWYVIYVVFWIKYWNLKLSHHCILFLFTICTVSQLFWNRVCTWTMFPLLWTFSSSKQRPGDVGISFKQKFLFIENSLLRRCSHPSLTIKWLYKVIYRHFWRRDSWRWSQIQTKPT